MKHNIRAVIMLITALCGAAILAEKNDTAATHVYLQSQEIEAIVAGSELYAYFGPEVSSLVQELPVIEKHVIESNRACDALSLLCDHIKRGYTTAPITLIENALQEAGLFLESSQNAMPEAEVVRLMHAMQRYYALFACGAYDVTIVGVHACEQDDTMRSRKCKSLCSLNVARRLTAGCLNVLHNVTVNGDLTVQGDEIIQGDLTVLGTIYGDIVPTPGSLILVGNPQQACIIFQDASLTEKARICSSPIPGDKGVFVSVDGGTTQNLRVNNEGGTALAAPTSGPALEVTGNALAPAIIATGSSTTTAPALQLIGNPAASATDFLLTINADGDITQSTVQLDDLDELGCRPGPLTNGTSDATSFNLVTSCTNRMVIDGAGAVTINMPTAGEALTVNGNIILPVTNGGGTQGRLELGGTSATNVSVYEVGTRNFFAGGGALNTTVSGTDNVSIGTTANSNVTTANNTVAIGTSAQATATDSIAIGDGANTAFARSIVIGSADSTSTGVAPTAGALNAIAIGSANGTAAGASAGGLASVALGAASSSSPGASSAGSRSVAIGVNASATAEATLALGSAGSSGGAGALASNTNAIALGGGNVANAGPVASGLASVAIGSADATFVGPVASGDRSIAFGVNAVASAALGMAIGSASGTAGGTGPQAITGANSIAIGSGSAAMAGPIAAGVSSMALGSANAGFAGAVTNANAPHSIAIGVGAATSLSDTIAIGTRTSASAANALAIGGASTAAVGASASATSAIAIGAAEATFVGASASGARSIAVGMNTTATQANAIAIGSASGTAGGTAANANAANAIAIGSGSGAFAGPVASGVAAMAIGSANTTGSSIGAVASGDLSIAIGCNASVTAAGGVAVGSASNSAGSTGASVTAVNGIAIGGSGSALAGPIASAAGGVAIGSASTAAGAVASGARSIAIGAGILATTTATQDDAIAIGTSAQATGVASVAIGTSATTSQANAIVLGSQATTAVRVGIGINAPTAKLHVVGVSGTPVAIFDQVDTAITSAPQWLNPSTSAVAGTPIHYDGSNRLFGFTSSRRYKQNIRAMENESAVLYKLNPVIYDAKKGHGEGTNIAGFIAEEVYEAAPHLAVLNGDCQPENVAYNSLHALAIKEIQKQQQQLDYLQLLIDDRESTLKKVHDLMKQLEAKVALLEGAV